MYLKSMPYQSLLKPFKYVRENVIAVTLCLKSFLKRFQITIQTVSPKKKQLEEILARKKKPVSNTFNLVHSWSIVGTCGLGFLFLTILTWVEFQILLIFRGNLSIKRMKIQIYSMCLFCWYWVLLPFRQLYNTIISLQYHDKFNISVVQYYFILKIPHKKLDYSITFKQVLYFPFTKKFSLNHFFFEISTFLKIMQLVLKAVKCATAVGKQKVNW